MFDVQAESTMFQQSQAYIAEQAAYAAMQEEYSSDMVAVIDSSDPMVQEEESDVSEYAALLTAEDTAVAEPAVEYVSLYTTNPMGDLPGTLVIDMHVGDYNNRVVRHLAVPADKVEAQRTSARSNGKWTFLCTTEAGWLAAQGLTAEVPAEVVEAPAQVEVPAVAQYPTSASSEVLADEFDELWTVPGDAEEEAEPEAEIPQAILDAQALDVAAKAMAEQYKALQEQMRIQAEQLKILQAQAAAAKAAAPVLITPELRIKLDVLNGILAGGEQGIAKAMTSGVLYVKVPGQAKRDTGAIRTVPRTPSSSGVVDLHHNGSSASSVNGKPDSMSPEKRAIILAIKEMIAGIPKELVRNNVVAEKLQIEAKLGLTRKQAQTLVWHVKDGNFADVS